MDFGSLMIIVAVFLLTVLILIRPFFITGKGQPQVESTHSSLLAEKERIFTAIEELEQEYILRKIPENDYQRKRGYLLKIAASVIQKLDQLGVETPSRALEEESMNLDDLEALIESRRQKLRQENRGFCPHCGEEVFQEDQFCGHCGETIR